MCEFVFLIGSTDDFDTLEELFEAYRDGTLENMNAFAYKFSLPDALAQDGGGEEVTLRIPTLIGRGLAFSDGWGMENTLSFYIKVS